MDSCQQVQVLQREWRWRESISDRTPIYGNNSEYAPSYEDGTSETESNHESEIVETSSTAPEGSALCEGATEIQTDPGATPECSSETVENKTPARQRRYPLRIRKPKEYQDYMT